MRILHMSDLHFGAKDKSKAALDQRKNFIKSLMTKIREISSRPEDKIDYIFVTGDIGWSGSRGDYAKAVTFFQQLLSICNVDSSCLFMCPGNHDIIRGNVKERAVPTTQKKVDEFLTIEALNGKKRDFQNYVGFCQRLNCVPYKIGELDSYLVGMATTSDCEIICMNTAWYAINDEHKRDLWVGHNFVESINANDYRDPDKISFVLMHHPESEWAEEEKRNHANNYNVLDNLAAITDYMLCGHTHETRSTPRPIKNACILGAGALYGDSIYENSFYIYDVDKSVCERTQWYYRLGEWKDDKDIAKKKLHS